MMHLPEGDFSSDAWYCLHVTLVRQLKMWELQTLNHSTKPYYSIHMQELNKSVLIWYNKQFNA